MDISADRSGAALAGYRVATAAASVDASSVRIRFETLTTLEALDAIGPEWDTLFRRAGAPQQVFQSHGWLRSWAANFLGRSRRLAILIGRVDGILVVVWPLFVEYCFGLRILRGMGEPFSQYADALLAPELEPADEDAIWARLMAQRVDVVMLRRVRDDAICTPLLQRKLGANSNRQAAPFIDLSETRDTAAFAARFSGKQRSDRRRRHRRLEERGALRITHYGPSAEAELFVSFALDFKRDQARNAALFAPNLFDPRFEQAFIDVARQATSPTTLRVTALHCGDELAGAGLSVVCQNRLHGHVLAPNPAFRSLGVGGILAEAIISGAIEAGYDGVDLLPPADPYKCEWTATSVGVGDYYKWRTFGGWVYTRLWLGRGRATAKQVARWLTPMVQRFRGRN